jgi:hypothetical protein
LLLFAYVKTASHLEGRIYIEGVLEQDAKRIFGLQAMEVTGNETSTR